MSTLSQGAVTSERAALVCHDEQMQVWSNEIVGCLSMGGYLREDMDYEDGLTLCRDIGREIRRIVEGVFDHPELATLAAPASPGVPEEVRRALAAYDAAKRNLANAEAVSVAVRRAIHEKSDIGDIMRSVGAQESVIRRGLDLSLSTDRLIAEVRSLLSAPTAGRVATEGETESLDRRLSAAGMFTVPEMMGETPMTRWETHSGMTSLAFFGEWLDRKLAEYLRMRVTYELGDKSKDDELYEWVLAHVGAFKAIRTNFKAAMASEATPAPTPVSPEPAAPAILSGAEPAVGGDGLSQAARDVLAERRRQVEVLGWSPQYDERHTDGALARAAAAYARHAGSDEDDRQVNSGFSPEDLWTLNGSHPWRPSSPRRELVKAGALILAEIERLDRITPPTPGGAR